jgi:Zn-dependent protease
MNPLVLIFQILVLIYSVVLHEVSHGLAARSMGDTTAERAGRLTLNPLSHLDMFGSFLLPLITYLTAGFMFGYAKPVPYNPYALNDRRWGPAKVAAAGPLTNLLLATLFGGVIRLVGASLSDSVVALLSYVVLINLGLAVFNLLPVPPLDGHWLLGAIVPGFVSSLYRFQWFLLFLAIFVLFPLLTPVIGGLFHILTGTALF